MLFTVSLLTSFNCCDRSEQSKKISSIKKRVENILRLSKASSLTLSWLIYFTTFKQKPTKLRNQQHKTFFLRFQISINSCPSSWRYSPLFDTTGSIFRSGWLCLSFTWHAVCRLIIAQLRNRAVNYQPSIKPRWNRSISRRNATTTRSKCQNGSQFQNQIVKKWIIQSR
jgi:hypothetical protein